MLHGRDAERSLVTELLDAARHSHSGVLVVRGDPGVGKTALLEDATDRATDMQVLTARGVESESELPFAAMHQLLGPILCQLTEIPAPQAGALGAALGLNEGRASERFLVFAGCLSLLAAAAEERPVLCVVDDAHWLDAASADAVLFVARRLGAEAVAILVGARESERGHFDAPGLPLLTLGGLGGEAAAALLEEGAGVRAAAAVRDRLVEQTRGNALALLELPSGLTEAQMTGSEPLPDALPLTDQVEAAFLGRAAALHESAQRLLLIAAADDSEDLPTVMRAAKSFGVDVDALTVIEEAGLLRVRGTHVEFRHPLVRSAVYGSAPSALRRRAHQVLAAALPDGEADADRRAWHLASAALEPDADVVSALEEAAARAESRAGHLAAARAYERAAELSADSADRGRRLVFAARAASLAGRDVQAVTLADQAQTQVDDPLLLAELARVRGEAATFRGRPADVIELLLEAARATAQAAPAQALELLMSASRAGVEAGVVTSIAEVARLAEAVSVARADEPALFMRRMLTGQGAMWRGDSELGTELLEQAITWAQTADDPRHVSWGSRAALFLGDHERAATLLHRAVELARAQGAIGVLATVLGLRALQLERASRYDDAVVAASEALSIARELGAPNFIPLPLGVLAIVSAIRGKDAEVREHAEEVRQIAGMHGLAVPAALAVWAQAILDIGRGRWESALEALTALTEVRPGFGTPVIAIVSAPDRVEAGVRAGRIDEARAALESFEAWATHTGTPWARPGVAVCRALLAGGDAATSQFEDALRLSADARPFDAARAQLLYGEHLRRQRRRADARVQLRAASDAFHALGATPWWERAQAELRATGETTHKRDPRALSELTPQELQVARLVGDGLSNKDAAAQLFLSPRTIDAHLRSVFAKLGVTSRTQLARHPMNVGDLADARAASPAQS
jgi:DNA-binding CsgD family transcriptional regulator